MSLFMINSIITFLYKISSIQYDHRLLMVELKIMFSIALICISPGDLKLNSYSYLCRCCCWHWWWWWWWHYYHLDALRMTKLTKETRWPWVLQYSEESNITSISRHMSIVSPPLILNSEHHCQFSSSISLSTPLQEWHLDNWPSVG